VAICFDDTDSAQIRELAAQGADLLVLITNDSWFSNSDEAVQHSWQALVRAAETGLPVVRCGNSGVTGTISRTGRVNWLVGSDGKPLVDAKGTMCEAVEIGRDFGWKSWYVRLGDIPLAVAFILLILSMIMVKYRNEYEKRRYLSM
jgi:apolipoprotein N-acyltransferase